MKELPLSKLIMVTAPSQSGQDATCKKVALGPAEFPRGSADPQRSPHRARCESAFLTDR